MTFNEISRVDCISEGSKEDFQNFTLKTLTYWEVFRRKLEHGI